MTDLAAIRSEIRADHLCDEAGLLRRFAQEVYLSEDLRANACARAARLVTAIREDTAPALMESFLAEYGLSSEEGVALMCLAEALLRVPDAETIDALIEDKIAPSEWGTHLGQSSSSLVNASTWGLMLTGRVLKEEGEGIAATLRGLVKQVGEPVIRLAVEQAIREMGRQFVLGRDIEEAMDRARGAMAAGFTYSYDMLGEAALTARDAEGFFAAYARSIERLAASCRSSDVRDNPGISIKLSALHPRFEEAKRPRVMTELVARTLLLARKARAAGMGFNIDAEEADRLELSLDVIEAVLSDSSLDGWDGFGVVVQAYGKRAGRVIDWLYALAEQLDRRVMVRLVKGAYWDTEVKRAQVAGLDGFPVFTAKAATDVSYLLCARKLLATTDRIYPQFATHNAHTVAAVLEMGADPARFEFQRLHGMGEALHRLVTQTEGVRCRIYAPVGAHRDLLAYLVRRLLENGANSSFVNQIVDASVPAEEVAADPFSRIGSQSRGGVIPPAALFPGRRNSRGFELTDPVELGRIEKARGAFREAQWQAGPEPEHLVRNPADLEDVVGRLGFCDVTHVEQALTNARPWEASASARAEALRRAADLFEAHHGELFALLAREAGKTLPDAVAELREAVDFLRYYADEGERLAHLPARGVFACISPWNFPLAIFTGQIAAALAAGNGVLAKPAEATSLIAARAVALLHEAGVPEMALQLLPGIGPEIGHRLTSDPRVDGVCFTGSTATAQAIHRSMAAGLAPDAPLIAETGGLNAMIVDSTALPEQAIRDIIVSAFQSAGQRCSALRVLYLQEDIAEPFLQMLRGAMDELALGAPWTLATDIGPVIDGAARAKIVMHIETARAEGRLLWQLGAPGTGHFVPPTVIRVSGIADLTREVFGPVLHVATFGAEEIDAVVDAVNDSGYGLTFGLHTRIDGRVQQVTERLRVGNLYVNRNQIGAIVGSQPFGGEGASGTGPKAGGPAYVHRFKRHGSRSASGGGRAAAAAASAVDERAVQEALRAASGGAKLSEEALPGPTGESNRLSRFGRGTVLCLGPSAEDVTAQMQVAQLAGCVGIDGFGLPPDALGRLDGFAAAISWADASVLRAHRVALAERKGAIVPLISEADPQPRLMVERHLCVDTTAAGGNAKLLAQAS